MIDCQKSKNYLTTEDQFKFPTPLSYLPLPKTKVNGNSYARYAGTKSITFTSTRTIPYGKWGDLCAMFICTSANRLKIMDPQNRTIEFNSVYEIMKQLGIYGTSGYQQHNFKDSLLLWSTLAIHFEDRGYSKTRIKNIMITDEAEIHYGEKEIQKSFLQLTNDAFDFFTTNVMPVQANVISKIRTSFELRIYLWLSRRTYYFEKHPQKDVINIKWNDLITQFGPVSRNHEPRFRKDFEEAINNIKSKFMPWLVFVVDKKMGVFLYPIKALAPQLDLTDKNILLAPPSAPTLPKGNERLTEDEEKEKAFEHFIACNSNEQFPAPEDSPEWHQLRAAFEAIYQKTKNKELY